MTDQEKVLENGASSAETENTDTGASDWIPRSRFNEVNNELKERRQELEKIKKQQEELRAKEEEARQKALLEQQEYKELWENAENERKELASYKERYEAFLAQTQGENEKRISQIPEKMRSLVPKYDDPLEVRAYLDQNWELFNQKQFPKLDGGAGGSGRADANENSREREWVIQKAQALNLDPVEFGKQFGIVIK